MTKHLLALASMAALAACNTASNPAPATPSFGLPEPALPLVMPKGGIDAFLDCLREGQATIISAHRGGPAPGFPENAIETLAWNASKAPMMFEIDVRQTADGVYVLYHDQELDQDSDGTGPLADKTLRELEEVRYNGTDIGISTLEEVIEWARGKTLLQLDVKPGVALEPLIEWLEERDATGFVLLITYNVRDAATVARESDDLLISASVNDADDLAALNAAGVPSDRISAWTGLQAPRIELWQYLQANGISANYGTYSTLDAQDGSAEAYKTLMLRGLNILSTDRQHFAYEALEASQNFEAAARACMGEPIVLPDNIMKVGLRD